MEKRKGPRVWLTKTSDRSEEARDIVIHLSKIA